MMLRTLMLERRRVLFSSPPPPHGAGCLVHVIPWLVPPWPGVQLCAGTSEMIEARAQLPDQGDLVEAELAAWQHSCPVEALADCMRA